MHPCLFFVCLSVLMLLGCRADIRIGDPIDEEGTQRLAYDFSNGTNGWQAGFSDFTDAEQAHMTLTAGIRPLPTDPNQNGYFLSATNVSADVFMFIKNRFRGLRASARYEAELNVTLLANAGANCASIGGPRGESMYVKTGFAPQEPMREGYYLNTDKGNQASNGSNASIIGDLANNQLDCISDIFAVKTLQTTTSSRLQFTTTESGRIWLFIGIDSGFEGQNDVYIRELTITVKPI